MIRYTVAAMRWPVLPLTLLLIAVLVVLGAGAGSLALAADEQEADQGEPKLKGEAKKKHDAEVKKHLAHLLDRKSQALVVEKIESVGARGTRAARDALIKFTIGRKSKRYVRAAFLEIGKIGGKGGVEFLCGKHALKSKDVLIAEGAADGLAKGADPRAVQPLLAVITKRGTKILVLGACAKALGKCAGADPKALEVVLEQSRHKKSSIRQPIAEALGFFGTDAAMDRMKEMLRTDSNAEVRAAAARGLGHSGDTSAIETLQEALKDERSMSVKSAAMSAITKLRGS